MEAEIQIIADALREALLGVLEPEDFDIAEAAGGIDISTDDWTLHIESDLAFFAVDDEPEAPDEFPTRRYEVLTIAMEGALSKANITLGNQLVELLLASGDPFSADLANSLGTRSTA